MFKKLFQQLVRFFGRLFSSHSKPFEFPKGSKKPPIRPIIFVPGSSASIQRFNGTIRMLHRFSRKKQSLLKIKVNKFIKDFNQAKQMMQGVLSGDMNKMMKQMGLNPNNMPKNMPGGMPDMSALEGMMGQGGMPDLSALGGGAGMPDMSQMFGGGLKGKAGEFMMKRAMNKMAKQMRKNKKKRK